ncbi:hypothetical protein CEXT_638151 [Caerostris extrusa]|uniref:Uncharacterized protein n=1 Tax=Caerostris extrusa TaxID=172846 RepID=A0AAV4PXN1_CAEEX|nr:hypothetical protein CEXT_638151 [Caerostris extrusa]
MEFPLKFSVGPPTSHHQSVHTDGALHLKCNTFPEAQFGTFEEETDKKMEFPLCAMFCGASSTRYQSVLTDGALHLKCNTFPEAQFGTFEEETDKKNGVSIVLCVCGASSTRYQSVLTDGALHLVSSAKTQFGTLEKETDKKWSFHLCYVEPPRLTVNQFSLMEHFIWYRPRRSTS